MILFGLICAGMIIVALLFIFPPLLQPELKDHSAEVREANLAVYRDQLRELDADLQNGIIGRAQYDQDHEEIERRLLIDVGAGKSIATKNKPAKAARTLVYVLALALPGIAVLMYLKVGTRAAVSATPARVSTTQSGDMTQQRIEANVAALEKRLAQKPDDGPGWAMLARSYSTLGRHKEASAAFEKATAAQPNDADLLTEYAYSLAMARGQDFDGKPSELLDKALQIDPTNLKALLFAGQAAFKAKRYDQAIDYWQKLSKQLPPKSEAEESLSEKISEAKRLAKTASSK
jgi:cytochrome c-type biogenesis protein CcmH